MKKYIVFTAFIILILAIGGALLYADHTLVIPRQTGILITSIYGALGSAVFGSAVLGWRFALPTALYGAMVSGFDFITAVIISTILMILAVVAFVMKGVNLKESVNQAQVPITLPVGCGILLKSNDSYYYQLFRGRERLYLMMLGSEYTNFDPTHALQSEEDFQRSEIDYVFEANEIRAINLYVDDSIRILSLHHLGKRLKNSERLALQAPETTSDVEAYLSGFPVPTRRVIPYQPSKEVSRAVSNVSVVLSTAGGLFTLLWIYSDVPNKLLAGMNAFIPLIALLLYCVFQQDVALEKDKSNDAILPIWFLAIFTLQLHSWDDPFMTLSQALLVFPIFAACVFLLYFTFQRNRRIKNTLVTLVSVIPFLWFSMFQLNYALDDGSRVVQHSGVVTWYAAGESFGNVQRQYYSIETDEGDHFYSVPGTVFDAIGKGDAVLLEIHTGFFGIDYPEVYQVTKEGLE